MSKKVYEQKFREAWLKDPILKNWLTTSESTTGIVAKCKFCGVRLTSRYADLKNHSNSKKHRTNEKIFLGPRPQQTLSFPKDAVLTQAKKAECRLALFICQHTAISNTDHLVDVCKSAFVKCTEHVQMHRTKCSNIIKNVLCPYFREDLREDVGNNKFSLLLDESTDISVCKYLGIVIIYYSPKQNQIITSYLELAPLKGSTADDIVDCVKLCLKNHNFSMNNLIGIGTDNAAVMTGINNGVYKKLKEEVPNLILIKCVCHSLQLAVSHASKEHLPRNLEFLIQETYNWFSKSSIRQAAYNQIFHLLNDNHDPLKIVQACNTRWLSIETAVSRIYEQWVELKTHFSIVRLSDKCYTAEILYQMFNDDVNYAFLSFLRPVLIDIQRLNKSFESNNTDPTKLLNSLIFLLESLINKICIPGRVVGKDVLDVNYVDFIDKNCYLGYNFETKVREMKENGFSEEINLRERCINFTVALINEIKGRLPDNIKVLRNISLVSVDEALKPTKCTLVNLLIEFGKPANTIDAIERQWQLIHLIHWNKIRNTKEFWYEVHNYKDGTDDNPFKDLANFALELLILPHSNAEVERLFSSMNLVKTKLRNRLQLPMLSSILTVKAGLRRYNQCCNTYQVPDHLVEKIKTGEAYKSDVEDVEDLDLDLI